MRLWSGTQVAFGNDHTGPAVLVMGNSINTIPSAKSEWKLELTKSDGTRIWRPINIGKLARIQVPCLDELSAIIKNSISNLPNHGLHPGIINGLTNEAERLYPDLNPDIVTLFSSFVTYLKDHYDLDESKMKSKDLENYVDGFGPELILKIKDKIVLIPEIPPVWLAPTDWSYSTWRVTNGMLGPVIDKSLILEKRLQFVGNFPDPDINLEGLIYFQAARSMIAWAAWEKDKTGRFFQAIASIIMIGHRPLKRK